MSLAWTLTWGQELSFQLICGVTTSPVGMYPLPLPINAQDSQAICKGLCPQHKENLSPLTIVNKDHPNLEDVFWRMDLEWLKWYEPICLILCPDGTILIQFHSLRCSLHDSAVNGWANVYDKLAPATGVLKTVSNLIPLPTSTVLNTGCNRLTFICTGEAGLLQDLRRSRIWKINNLNKPFQIYLELTRNAYRV